MFFFGIHLCSASECSPNNFTKTVIILCDWLFTLRKIQFFIPTNRSICGLCAKKLATGVFEVVWFFFFPWSQLFKVLPTSHGGKTIFSSWRIVVQSSILQVENARHYWFFSTSKFANLHTIRCEIVWWHRILYQIWELTIQQGDVNGFTRTPRMSDILTFRMCELRTMPELENTPSQKKTKTKTKTFLPWTHRCQLIWSVFRFHSLSIVQQLRNLSYDQPNTCSFHVVIELS